MSKIFIAFQFRGENPGKVENWLNIIRNEILERKKDYFCSFWAEDYFNRNKLTIKQIYDYCLRKLGHCKTVIFLLRSKKNSEGMKIELDFALKNKKKIIVIIKKGLEFEQYRKNADYLLEIKDLKELNKKINEIKL